MCRKNIDADTVRPNSKHSRGSLQIDFICIFLYYYNILKNNNTDPQ